MTMPVAISQMGRPKRKAKKLTGPAMPTTATSIEYHPSNLGNGLTPRFSKMASPLDKVKKTMPTRRSSSLFWL